MDVFQTLVVALVGGFIGYRLKIPAGAFIGAMVASALFNIAFARGYLPFNFRLVAQMVVGGYIGLNFSRESIVQIKSSLFPIIFMVIGLFLFSIVLGIIIHKVTDIDLITAMLGSSPGGLTEMSIIADSYGADISTVATMHLIRIMSVVLFLPTIMRKVIELFFSN